MNIQQHAQQDPDSFYTKRWADGYMVYHGRSYCFSYSITRAKARLIELRESISRTILVEIRRDVDRESELITRIKTYGYYETGSREPERITQFTTMYPAQNDPKLFALRKRRLCFACREHRLKYEAMFDCEWQ